METPLDNRFILRRDDVLVYTSEPLKRKLLLAGRPTLKLHASSDRRDTDWFATLSDVYPDERSVVLGGCVLRARYRNSLERPELLTPNEIYCFTLEFGSMCNLFRPAHVMRLAIMSSSFPTFARNQNTGNEIWDDVEVKIARNIVYHDSRHPSHLILPTR